MTLEEENKILRELAKYALGMCAYEGVSYDYTRSYFSEKEHDEILEEAIQKQKGKS